MVQAGDAASFTVKDMAFAAISSIVLESGMLEIIGGFVSMMKLSSGANSEPTNEVSML
jgi:hypothetical protein